MSDKLRHIIATRCAVYMSSTQCPYWDFLSGFVIIKNDAGRDAALSVVGYHLTFTSGCYMSSSWI